MWRDEYLARADEMLNKWEGELEEKLALAESDPDRFLEWAHGVIEFGWPLINGLVDAYNATARSRLQAVVGTIEFLRSWFDLLSRVNERKEAANLGLPEGSERRWREVYLDTSSLMTKLESRD